MNEYARSYCGGQQPESALEIDVAIAHPAAVTLEELEALSVLEPYGSGNARPLFCLLGATLLHGLFGLEPFTVPMAVLLAVCAVGASALFHWCYGVFGRWHEARLARWA